MKQQGNLNVWAVVALWAGLCVVLGLMGGCSGEPMESPTGCRQDSDCLLGWGCRDGLCTDECREEECPCGQDSDCAFRLVCTDGTCQPSDLQMCGPTHDCLSNQRDPVTDVCSPVEAALPTMTDPEGCPAGMSPEGVCLPAPPLLPQWSCSHGWQPVQVMSQDQLGAHWPDTLGLPTSCRPPDMPTSCPSGWMPVVGSASCVRMGPECPKNGALWPDEEALKLRVEGFDGRTWFVSPSGSSEGDGTRRDPLGSIAAAVELASHGDTIVVSMGTFTETVALQQHVALVGACVEGTIIQAPDLGTEAIVRVDSGSSGRRWVSDLTLTGARPGLEVVRSPDVEVHAVHIDGAAGVGMVVRESPAVVELDRVWITDTRPIPIDKMLPGGVLGLGLGLFVAQGAKVAAQHLTLLRNHRTSLVVLTAADVELVDSAVVETQLYEDDGRGIHVQGARLLLERTFIGHHTTDGLFATGVGTVLKLSRIVVAETQPNNKGQLGRGMSIQEGARMSLEHALVTDNTGDGIFVADADTQATLAHVSILHTQPEPAGRFGRGLTVQGGAHIAVQRALISDNHDVGFLVSAGTGHQLEHVIVHRTGLTLDPGSGRGLVAKSGAEVHLNRALILDNHDNGVLLDGASATLTDVVVGGTQTGVVLDARERRDGLMQASGTGSGIVAQHAPQMALKRVVITHNHASGLDLFQSRVEVADTIVEHTQVFHEPWDDPRAVGLWVGAEAFMVGQRVVVRDNMRLGVLVRGAQAHLSDVMVMDTMPDGEPQSGVGWLAYDGAQFTLSRALVSGNHNVGVAVTDPASQGTLKDVTLVETQPHPQGGAGYGLTVQHAAWATVERALLWGNHGVGLLMDGQGTTGQLSDLVIRETRPNSGLGGDGLIVQAGSNATVTRSRFEGNARTGVLVSGAQAHMRDVVIRETQSNTPPGATDELLGSGLVVTDRSDVRLEHFASEGNALNGVQIARNSRAVIREGHIQRNFFGLADQSDAFNANTLQCVQFANCCGQPCEAPSAPNCNIESGEQHIPYANVVVGGLPVPHASVEQ